MNGENRPLRATSHTGARDHIYTLQALSLLEKAEPVVQLHTILEGPTEYVNVRRM